MMNMITIAQPTDVICGRGKIIANHPGNQRLKIIVKQHLKQYKAAVTKIEKSIVVSSIVDTVRACGGDFVKVDEESGSIEKVTERIAREKVGQGLRDALHTIYKSSTQAKRRRKQAEQEIQNDRIAKYLRSNEKVYSLMTDLKDQVTTEEMGDQKAYMIFNAANSKILEELKRCQQAKVVATTLVTDSETEEDEVVSV